MCRPVILHPESRGEIRLRSADPRDTAAIHQNFLAEPKDWDTLRKGIEMMRDLTAPEVARSLPPQRNPAGRGGEIAAARSTPSSVARPGPRITRSAPAGWERRTTTSQWSIPSLRVRGISSLRVVDASVMPDMVGGNINAPIIMIAEKASDLIRGKAVLPAATI